MTRNVPVHASDRNPAMMKQLRIPIFVYHGVIPYEIAKPMVLRMTMTEVVECPLMSLKQSTLYDSAMEPPVTHANVRTPSPKARPTQWMS